MTLLEWERHDHELRLTVETGWWRWKRIRWVQGSGTVWRWWPSGQRCSSATEGLLSDFAKYVEYQETTG